MTELHLFAGAGGGILGGMLLGHTTVAAVEIEPFCQEVLHARQRDGLLPAFPVYGDIREFDGRPWQGRVDVVAGGFPCQDISVAGRGAGLAGERSGLWAEFARVIGEVQPRYAFIENSPALVRRGLDRVLADLAALGMDARWCVLGADDAGAPHIRKRIWILAYIPGSGREAFGLGTERAGAINEAGVSGASVVHAHGNGSGPRRARRPDSAGSGERQPDAPLAHADTPGLEERRRIGRHDGAQQSPAIGDRDGRAARRPQSGMGRMAHGLAGKLHRSIRAGRRINWTAANAASLARIVSPNMEGIDGGVNGWTQGGPEIVSAHGVCSVRENTRPESAPRGQKPVQQFAGERANTLHHVPQGRAQEGRAVRSVHSMRRGVCSSADQSKGGENVRASVPCCGRCCECAEALGGGSANEHVCGVRGGIQIQAPAGQDMFGGVWPSQAVGRGSSALDEWIDRSNSGGLWASDPADEGRMGRTATGIPRRAARLKALGNGQVPQVAALAWRVLTAGLEVNV